MRSRNSTLACRALTRPSDPTMNFAATQARAALDFLLFRKSRWAILVALLLVGAGSLSQLPPDHALFDGALHKAEQAGSIIFFKGILANWIVCLAVRVALRCKEEVAKILVLISIVFIFVYLGFEHSIANMGTFSMAMLGGGTLTLGEALHNLLYSTLGNVVGGALLVGLPFTYLNPREREEQLVRVD